MRRAGFTLIEIMIVVGIIAIMLASAVMSVASGRGAVRVKEATRGVMQLSRYASALALLRQKPVVVTFHHGGRIEVRISGEADGADGAEGEGKPADPIYRELDGKATVSAEEVAEEEREAKEDAAASTSAKAAEKEKGYFYTRQVLDPEVLAKEDAEGEYEGVTFTVEVLGEDGEPLDPDLAAARSLQQPKRERKNPESDEQAVEDSQEDLEHPPVSVTYEPNGNVNPYRVFVRLEGASSADEGFAINISRSGKATVGDDEKEEVRRVRRRRRR